MTGVAMGTSTVAGGLWPFSPPGRNRPVSKPVAS
jgi:hypothetical protein